MKLSLSWIFDHIVGNWRDLAINEFIQKFNNTIAEVDFHEKITTDLDSLAIGVVTKMNGSIFLFVPEWNKEFQLPPRKDINHGGYYLVKKESKEIRYATLSDFGSEKDGLLPELWVIEPHLKGEWKATCAKEDYVLFVDNKSLTHRPDLWGHRGIAREVAAMLNLDMIPEERFLIPCIIKNYEKITAVSEKNPILLDDDASSLCDRLAGIYLNEVTARPSLISCAQRLASIDARPIDALVDATNYVMYDIGQPLHAFDAEELRGKVLKARAAQKGEKLTLLDGETIELDPSDCVIADEERVLSLAGIMGGMESGIKASTTRILVESAHFNATAIRRSSLRHKIRTESSARFEKDLDANQNTMALMRFLYLLDSWAIEHDVSKEIVSIGKPASEKSIMISPEFIAKKIGMTITGDTIKRTLSRLGFGIQEDRDGLIVTVPTHRIRDVSMKEDIVEEIARFIGYDSVPYSLPLRAMRPLDHHRVQRIREIKRHCAFAYGMHELSSYSLYDEEFLRILSWQPENGVYLSNPVSENWQRLVTSLVPNLLKAVKTNSTLQQNINFFEWGRVWTKNLTGVLEKKALSGIWYQPNGEIDFYALQADLRSLFDLIKAPVLWQKTQKQLDPWFHPYQTAELVCGDQVIGYAGKTSPALFSQLVEGDAFIVSIDGNFLQTYVHPELSMHPLAKYPHTDLDISMFVPITVSVADLESAVALADARIRDVYLVDYFEKDEWQAVRSITLRYRVIDDFKTLTKEEIAEIAHDVREAVKALGVTIR